MRNRTYRYFDGPVLYPFGYGLSYSQFRYQGLRLSSQSIAAGDSVTASVIVRNISERVGDEITEVYVQVPGPDSREHPFLAGFQRVHLAAGQARRITIPIDPRELSRVDDAGMRKIVNGNYTIEMGGGQPQFAPGVSATLKVTGTKNLEE